MAILAICDCNFSATSGDWEVVDQRDWHVPEFSINDLKNLCDATKCDKVCKECVITRLKTAIFEDQY